MNFWQIEPIWQIFYCQGGARGKITMEYWIFWNENRHPTFEWELTRHTSENVLQRKQDTAEKITSLLTSLSKTETTYLTKLSNETRIRISTVKEDASPTRQQYTSMECKSNKTAIHNNVVSIPRIKKQLISKMVRTFHENWCQVLGHDD